MATPRARILIVDDEAEVCAVLGEFLESEGYDVIFAETAVGALAAVREQQPQLVLLDLNMPGAVSGATIVQAISQTVPVVVISAVIDLEVARGTLRQGAADFIAKPFDLARVGEVVVAVLLASGR
jgi:two-component system response regulator MtrA